MELKLAQMAEKVPEVEAEVQMEVLQMIVETEA